MKKSVLLALFLVAVGSLSGVAQDVATQQEVEAPKTLFPYPVAPDTIQNFENRVNYIVPRFWDNYNLAKPISDIDAFDGAFCDYLGLLRFCHKTVAISSVRNFMFKAQANVSNFEKIAALADKELYQVGAEFWSDELYMEFISQVVKNKSVKADVRKYYAKQMERINRTLVGESLAELTYTNLDGNKARLGDIEADMLFIYISKDEDSDHSFERVRLSTDVGINNVLETGAVKLLCISPAKYDKEWAHHAKDYSSNWMVGACPELSMEGNYDVRYLPSFIVLDKEKKIVQKNVSLESLKQIFNR